MTNLLGGSGQRHGGSSASASGWPGEALLSYFQSHFQSARLPGLDATSGTCKRERLNGAAEPTALPRRLLPSYHLHPSDLTFYYPFSFIPSHIFPSFPLPLVQRPDLNEADYATQRALRCTHVSPAFCAMSFLCNLLHTFFSLRQFVYASVLRPTLRGCLWWYRDSRRWWKITQECARLELRHEQTSHVLHCFSPSGLLLFAFFQVAHVGHCHATIDQCHVFPLEFLRFASILL